MRTLAPMTRSPAARALANHRAASAADATAEFASGAPASQSSAPSMRPIIPRAVTTRAIGAVLALFAVASPEPAPAQPGRPPIVISPQSPAGPGQGGASQGGSSLGNGGPGGGAGAQQPVGDRDIVVLNHSKQVANELYISPSTADEWGDDRLGDDTLDPGKSIHVRLGRTRDCEFDAQMVYDDGSHEEARRINVCRTRQYAFDGSTAIAASKPAGAGAHAVTIINDAGRPIQQVFISPADANQWGDDRLDDESLSVGDRKRIDYSGDCAADLRVVFDNRSAEERHGLNVCQQTSFDIRPGWTTADAAPAAPGAGGPAQPPAADTSRTPSAPIHPLPGAEPAPAAEAPPAEAPPAEAPAGKAITVVNHSGHPAAEVYVYPDGAADRGPDRLGIEELKDGASLVLHIDLGTACKFNVHAVYGGHGVADGEIRGANLCAGAEIVLPP